MIREMSHEVIHIYLCTVQVFLPNLRNWDNDPQWTDRVLDAARALLGP
jgi:hypothetical protein